VGDPAPRRDSDCGLTGRLVLYAVPRWCYLYDRTCYIGDMARAISVRLDDEADRALRVLESTGLTQSEAIRVSLLGELRHRRRSKELAAEVAALEADGQDHDEMLAVAELMEALRAPR
jgi:antitoxin component of RelBE/YafQ-DinJ toxin-antitoxin module